MCFSFLIRKLSPILLSIMIDALSSSRELEEFGDPCCRISFEDRCHLADLIDIVLRLTLAAILFAERIGRILWFYFYFKKIVTLLSSKELEEFCDSTFTLKKLWLTLCCLRENWKNFVILLLFQRNCDRRFIVFERIGRILWFYFYFKKIAIDALLSLRKLEEFCDFISSLKRKLENEEFFF